MPATTSCTLHLIVFVCLHHSVSGLSADIVNGRSQFPALKGSAPRYELDASQQSRLRPAQAGLALLAGTDGAELNLSGSVDCIENNGGTCTFQSCFAWRGSQTCHLGRCFCKGGQCAGTDGMCHDEQNEVIGTRYLLRNLRFPDYYITTTRFGYDLWVERGAGRQSEFDLRKLPGSGYATDPLDFLLTPTMYPDYAVITRERSDSSDRSSSVTLDPTLEHVTFPMETGVQYLALNFERIPEHPETVMISSFMYPRDHYYIPRMSWGLDTSPDDPGTGAYWIFDPPLPNETMDRLRTYHGPRCTWFCGLGSKLAPSHVILWLSVLSMLSAQLR